MASINYREMYIKIIMKEYKDKKSDEYNYNKIRRELNKYNLIELKKYSEEIENR